MPTSDKSNSSQQIADLFKTEEDLRLILMEIESRAGAKFDLKKFCYPKQYDFVTDEALYADAVTSRRSGKTTGCAADLLDTALKFPDCVCLYITLARASAKIILWPMLKRINELYKLGGIPNEADLSMKMKNGAMIYLAGAKDASEIEKFRGMAIKKVYIDEGQSMRAHIRALIDDVLEPACTDHNGKIRIIGTPGPVPVGYFHEIATSKEWSHHQFTIWDNPFIENAKERLEAVLKRRGVTIDDPSIQREWFGRWALDTSALVLRYDAAINHFDALPTGVIWDHIVIADFGYVDADAIATLAFSDKHPNAYLIEEKITTKQGITPLAEQLKDHMRRYKPMKVLGDFGALGKKIGEELQKRFEIPIEAAEKSRKLEYIELLNDSLRTGRFKAKRDSQFAQDAMLMEWDRTNPEKPEISDRFHSDIGDAVIYGHRELLHWLWKEAPKKIEHGSEEHYKQQQEDMWDNVRNSLQQNKEDENFWRSDFDDET